MDTILELFKLDFPTPIIGMFYPLSTIITMTTIVGRFSELTGEPVHWLKKKQKNRNPLIRTAKNLDALQQKHEENVHQSIRHDGITRGNLKKLTDIFIDKEISNLRWEIIKFSTTIAGGKPCNGDSCKYRIRAYEKYGKLLADNDMGNGEVELSMELVREPYKEKLKNES